MPSSQDLLEINDLFQRKCVLDQTLCYDQVCKESRVSKVEGNNEGDEEDLSSLAESLLSSTTSTPTPPPEYVARLQQAEAMIQKLQHENVAQRLEVRANLRSKSIL